MSNVLKHVKLDSYLGIFEEQKISPDIVCKLSMYDFQCLGIVNRSDIMRLRIECVKFGSCQPDLISNHHLGRHEFSIPKTTIEGLLEAGFTVLDISNTLSVSETTVYRRMRQYNLSRLDFSDVSDETLDFTVNEIIREFPRCGETMIRQILFHKNMKVCVIS
ncbi:hypothetical protein ACJMK2_009200 [Sinanodonta woodiana]|uniref:Uncharacterized protein n=1 Tax=Sinanodonta woodiana TaxID=1069815 RepID=A0ABD3VEL6_SINWO